MRPFREEEKPINERRRELEGKRKINDDGSECEEKKQKQQKKTIRRSQDSLDCSLYILERLKILRRFFLFYFAVICCFTDVLRIS